jgi:hypothetical protein
MDIRHPNFIGWHWWDFQKKFSRSPNKVFTLRRVITQMKFQRCALSSLYLMHSAPSGTSMNSLNDPQMEAVRHFFLAMEYACIYLPTDWREFIACANERFATSGMAPPPQFRDTVQYFINSQLHFIATRAARKGWVVEKETRYRADSKYIADLKVRVCADEYREHRDFSIWFESDNARTGKLTTTLSEKVPIIMRSPGAESDIFVSVVYATTPRTWEGMRSAISGIKRVVSNNRTVGNWNMSFVVLYLNPPRTELAQVPIDSPLMLFESGSLRVANRYFFGSTLSGAPGDYYLLDDEVTDQIERALMAKCAG